jgi:hypothetical protein
MIIEVTEYQRPRRFRLANDDVFCRYRGWIDLRASQWSNTNELVVEGAAKRAIAAPRGCGRPPRASPGRGDLDQSQEPARASP